MLFFLFLIIDTYFLIAAIITQTFNPIGEPKIPKEIPAKVGKAEMETHLVIVKTKIKKCPIQFRVLKTFSSILFINSFFIYSSVK